MDKGIEKNMREERIETTIGDLIFAISEAASEARIDESEISELTQLILNNVLDRYQH